MKENKLEIISVIYLCIKIILSFVGIGIIILFLIGSCTAAITGDGIFPLWENIFFGK